MISILVVNGAEKRPKYAGRKPSAATATGLGARAHNAEQVQSSSLSSSSLSSSLLLLIQTQILNDAFA